MDDRPDYLLAAVALLTGIAVALFSALSNTLPLYAKSTGYIGILIVGIAALLVIHRTGGTRAKAHLDLVAYFGYDAYVKRISSSVRKRFGISLRCTTVIGREMFDGSSGMSGELGLR